jgi:cytochrome c553
MKRFIRLLIYIFSIILFIFIFFIAEYFSSVEFDSLSASASKGIGHNLLLESWDGNALYDRYCQTCHGEVGEGDGPAVKVLPNPPIYLKDSSVLKNLDDFKKYLKENKPIKAIKEITHYTQKISKTELTKLIYYFLELKKLKPGQPPRYVNITYSTSCMFCHGFLANGKGIIKNFFKKKAYNFRERKAKKLGYKQWLRILKKSQEKIIKMGDTNPHFYKELTPEESEKLFTAINKFIKNSGSEK